MSATRSFCCFFLFLCAVSCEPIPEDLSDNPDAYIHSPPYRRGILERDLRETTSKYSRDRLTSYGRATFPWEVLPEWDPPSRGVTPSDIEQFANGETPGWGTIPAEGIAPRTPPTTHDEWVELGKRVFFEYPLRDDAVTAALVTVPQGIQQTGFLEEDGEIVGLRLFQKPSGEVAIGNTCAQCHAGRGPDGIVSGSQANKDMDIGAIRLLVMGLTPGELPSELESTGTGDLDRLGPGRGDVQSDGVFNPFAFPDLGGIGQMPLLHHNATWDQGGVATMAVRCETLFITASGQKHRIPRVLSWALAEYYHSLLPPPAELSAMDFPEEAARGEELFEEEGCTGCHVPPLYTSDEPIPYDVVGTDPSATTSPTRGTGFYRVPSLRGVSQTAPYLHHGEVDSLELMLDPNRLETTPGHEFGHELSPQEKDDLVTFLRTL
jgi:hypothetical protein